MKYSYRSSRAKQRRSGKQGSGRATKFFLVVIVLFLAVIVGFVLFLVNKINQGDEQGVEVMTDDAFAEVVIEEDDSTRAAQTEPVQAAASFEEAVVMTIDSGAELGFARRDLEEGMFTFATVVTLPPVSDIHYYEVWLLKPGITEYFSAGEMSVRADGKFAFVFEETHSDARDAEERLEYSQFIITREVRDDDKSPSATRVARGRF